MNKILMEQGRKYRLDKVASIKELLDKKYEREFSGWELVFIYTVLGSAFVYFGVQIIIYFVK